MTGQTSSLLDFPITAGAFQPTYGGEFNDAFITKLNSKGSDLIYSTYLGGSGNDQGISIVIDKYNNAYVTGQTDSLDFPITATAFQPTFGGVFDAFVTKLNPTGSGLIYSTYLGGSDDDSGNCIVIDNNCNAYVTGQTFSNNFPTTPGNTCRNV